MRNADFFKRAELNTLFRYGIALCNNESDAYDLLHYAIEKYLQQPVTPEPGADSRTQAHNQDLAYVRTIMRHRFIDDHRKSTRFPEQPYDDNSLVSINESPLDDIVIAQLDLEIIWKKLSVTERELLFYWAVEGRTAQEIAQQTDTPRGTILSRLHRIREKFAANTETEEISQGHTS